MKYTIKVVCILSHIYNYLYEMGNDGGGVAIRMELIHSLTVTNTYYELIHLLTPDKNVKIISGNKVVCH